MRKLTYDQVQALKSDIIRAGIIVELDHPSGYTRVWTGVGTLEWKGHDYVGLGLVSRIETLRSAQKLRIQEIKYVLRALPEDLNTLINANVRNRTAKMWVVFLTENFTVGRAEPILLNDTRLDRQTVEIRKNGRADLVLTAFNGVRELEIASAQRWSPEDQKQAYPNDSGLDRVYLYENREVTWTRT